MRVTPPILEIHDAPPGGIYWINDNTYGPGPALLSLPEIRAWQQKMRAFLSYESDVERREREVRRVRSFPRLNVRLLLASGMVRRG